MGRICMYRQYKLCFLFQLLQKLLLHLSAHKGEVAKGTSCHMGPMKGETETWAEWGRAGEDSTEHKEAQGLSAPILSSSTVHTAVLPTAHTADLMINPSSPQASEADKERKGSIKMVILRSHRSWDP